VGRRQAAVSEVAAPVQVQPAVRAAPPPAKAGAAPVITVPSLAEPGERYKSPAGTTLTPPAPQQKPLATTEQPTVPKTPLAVPQQGAPPVQTEPRVKPPVINVPPPAPGARGEELDLAY